MTRFILSFCTLILLFSNCKKNEQTEPDPTATGSITGNVILPQGSTINVNDLKVQSPIAESLVANGSYSIAVFTNKFNSTIVENTNGNAVLMGYNYPGSNNNDITVNSTALAITLNTPLLLSLSEEAKLDLIPVIEADTVFASLVLDIESVINSGRDLYDTNNVALLTDLGKIATNIYHKTTDIANSPVQFNRTGRQFTFYNYENIFASVVGIYRDGQLESKIDIRGNQVFPTSMQEIFNGHGSIITGINNDGLSYTLQGDGTYDIKIRTGLPFHDDGTPEFSQASLLNCAQISLYMIKMFLPIAQNNPSCLSSIASTLNSQIHGITNVNNAAGLAYFVFNSLYQEIGTVAICLGANDIINHKYFKFLKNFFKWIDRPTALIGNAMNIGFYLRQWSQAPFTFDTCFIANGNSVTSCNVGCGAITDIDGNIYNGVSIGTQCWMKENLATSRYRNGDPIPQITDPVQWVNTTSGAWCYFNNDANNGTTYGKLYNWYAINDPRGLAPTGFHIPNDAEWATLTSYLGGEVIAGGKMKTTSLWLAPNTGATNSSGFSGLPGGLRLSDGTWNGLYLGAMGNWWSTTQYNVNEVGCLILTSTEESVQTPPDAFYTYGLSVRCIRD